MIGRKASEREKQMFELLVREHHKRVLAYVQSLVSDSHAAEDIVQDTFLTAYLKFDRFDPIRSFGAWVRGIARMKCLEWGRSRRDVPANEAAMEAIEAQYADWDRANEEGRGDIFDVLHACLKQLPELLSTVVHCFYFDRMSCELIASQASISEATVRQRLHRGREALHECVEKGMQE